MILIVCSLILGAAWSVGGCQTPDKTITLDLTSTHNGELFHTPIKIGRDESDQQKFNMLVATGYVITWITSSDLNPIRGYRNVTGDEYDTRKVHLGLTGTLYGGEIFHAHYNTMQLGSQTTIDRQAFAVTHSPGYYTPTIPNVDGVLGLTEDYGAVTDIDDPFHHLYKLKHIDHLRYSLYINNSAVANRLAINSQQSVAHQVDDQQQQPKEGALVLGGVDSKYYSGEFRYVELVQILGRSPFANVITIQILDVQLDWSRVNPDQMQDDIRRLGENIDLPTEPMGLKLDSTLTLFMGPKRMLDNIHVDILGAQAIVRNNIYAFQDCRLDNKPDFVFNLRGGFDVRLTPEDYVIEHELNGRRVCLSAFKPTSRPHWLFGTRFLRKYYTVFDYENYRVGFAQPN